MELTPMQFVTLNRVAQPRSGIELFTTTLSGTGASELQAWRELQTLGLVTVTARENDGETTIWAAQITTAGREVWRDAAYGPPPSLQSPRSYVPVYDDGQLKLRVRYSDGKIRLEVPNGYVIQSFFTGDGSGKLTLAPKPS